MPADTDRLRWLSRFFFACNSIELQDAYVGLKPTSTVDDWSAVEFSFNRLFAGPRALQAPPYASIYLDGGDTRLMGNSTELMRSLYELMGLESPWLDNIPDDHLGLELDALWQIETALEQVDSEQLRDLRRYLFIHLMAWVPQFASRVRTAENVHAVILFVIEQLDAALAVFEYSPALESAV